MDASSLGAISALLTTTVPAEKFDTGDNYPLPVRDLPVSITSLVADGKILIDPSRDEMSIGHRLITITSDQKDNIVSIQKSGSYHLTEEKFYELIEISLTKSKEIRDMLGKI
jgi:exosome complex component RRP42